MAIGRTHFASLWFGTSVLFSVSAAGNQHVILRIASPECLTIKVCIAIAEWLILHLLVPKKPRIPSRVVVVD